MKTIGLIGGMSWESSQHYYRIVNETVRARLGGLHSAQCLMYSVDFEPIERMQARAEWDRAAGVLGDIEGRSYEEVAATLGVKLGTVRSRIHRGRAQLRVALEHRRPRTAARPAASASAPSTGATDAAVAAASAISCSFAFAYRAARDRRRMNASSPGPTRIRLCRAAGGALLKGEAPKAHRGWFISPRPCAARHRS